MRRLALGFLVLAAAAHAFAADPAAEAGALAARAAEAQALGFRQKAIEDLERAAALLSGRGDARALAASVSGALGQAYLRAGNADKARPRLEEAVRTGRAHALAPVLAAALNDLGQLHAAAGRRAEALAAFRESLSSAREADAPIAFAAAAVNVANLKEIDSGNLLEEAAARLARAPDSRETDFARIRLARAWRSAHSSDKPHQLLSKALAAAEARGDFLSVSYAAGNLGELYGAAGRDEEALELTRRAVFAAQSARSEESLYRWNWQAARLLARSGSRDAALAAYRRALAGLQAVRQDLILELRAAHASWRDSVGPLFLETADLLLRGNKGEAPPQADLVEARNLVEQLKAVELEDYFQDECVAAQLAKEKDIGAIAERTAVLYPVVLPDRLEMLVGLKGGIRQVTLPIGASELAREAHGFRRLLEKRTTHQYLPYARRLYAAIFRPLEAILAENGVDTVVFIPDGPLRGMPIAALHDGKGFLVERFAFATAPGLTLVEPQPIGERKQLQVLLNGLTESVQNFPPLPFVEDELAELQAMFADGRQLRDREFRVPSFEQELRGHAYSIVHIASHGEFDSDPRKSFLLTYDGRLDMNGLEQVIKLARFRDDPVELLTLSACRTAAGDDRASLGLAGVAVKAGARSALATLWYVNDQASSMLVAGFYRQLRDTRAPKAKALQHAQRAILADPRFRHPGYWAPFLLIGNWL